MCLGLFVLRGAITRVIIDYVSKANSLCLFDPSAQKTLSCRKNLSIFVVFSRVFIEGKGLATYASSVSFWTPRTLFFDSLDTQKFVSEFADEYLSFKIEDVDAVVSLL